MTPANRKCLEGAGQALIALAKSKAEPSNVALSILRVDERLRLVLTDLIFRPEANEESR